MVRPVSVLFLLGLCPAGLATWAVAPAYYACLAACNSGAAAGGLMGGVASGGVLVGPTMVYGAAACAYVCGAPSGLAVAVSGGFLCFGDGASVHLPDGSTIPVERLAEGNVTLAMEMGSVGSLRTHAKVVYARREEGSFAGRKLVYGQGGKTITVTDNHLMFTVVNGTMELRQAKDLAVGDILLSAAGVDDPLNPVRVASTEAVMMRARNIVATSEGTILVESLTMTAMCDAPSRETCEGEALTQLLQRFSAADVVQLWKASHVTMELMT